MLAIRFPLLALAALLLMGAAGPATCSLQNEEANLLALAGQVRANIPVAVDKLQGGIDSLCSRRDAVNGAAQDAKAVIAQGGMGPNARQNTAIVNKSLGTLDSVCAASPGASGPALARLFMEGLAAYQTVTGAVQAASGN